jgi:hypothetical protein
MEDSFKKLLKRGTSTDRVQSYVFYIVLGIVVIGNLTTINADNYRQNLAFAGVITLIFAIYYWFNRYKFKPLKFWIAIFEETPEELIWVKPITTKHQAYFITYSKSYQFQIYLKDGTNTKVDCPQSHKKIFYRMLRTHAPHAHLGYSRDVEKIYRRHRKRFLERLNEKGLLCTVNDYNL